MPNSSHKMQETGGAELCQPQANITQWKGYLLMGGNVLNHFEKQYLSICQTFFLLVIQAIFIKITIISFYIFIIPKTAYEWEEVQVIDLVMK